MTTHFEYLDEWFSKSAFGNTNLKRERKSADGTSKHIASLTGRNALSSYCFYATLNKAALVGIKRADFEPVIRQRHGFACPCAAQISRAARRKKRFHP